ncbi:hypothetical protein BDBG_09062 [Blastomyces gilchristii SLH14081]|uniref:Uncharacterized protein n=1 Tax=Blastomyces gilchristii (strain SLH14081) TaxID=559298 RepID=A0A179V0U1_BLAGS|nr:uncharacterized protein BDBG_09062 [Blastomyces gilchristii SLH14081]OAT13954.1 hypothetical protein BDBG_09062 [Blastomyces gilchristii SLH14081]
MGIGHTGGCINIVAECSGVTPNRPEGAKLQWYIGCCYCDSKRKLPPFLSTAKYRGDVCASLNRVHLSPQIDMNLQYSLRGSWCMVGWAIRPPPNNWNWLCGYEMSRVACGGYHLLEPSLFYTLQLGVKDSEVYGSPSRTVTISMEERNVASKASLTKCHLLRKGEATTSLANRWRTISTRLLPISNYLQQRGRRPLCLFSRCIVKSQRLGKETTERYSNSQGMFTSTLDEADRPTVTVFICEESLRSGSERATQVQYRVFTTLV